MTIYNKLGLSGVGEFRAVFFNEKSVVCYGLYLYVVITAFQTKKLIILYLHLLNILGLLFIDEHKTYV